MRRGLILAGLVVTALGGALAHAGPKPLVIGLTISETGSAAGTVTYVLQGYQRRVGDANHHVWPAPVAEAPLRLPR